MSKPLKLDLEWLDKAMADLRSSTSSVLVVQTADPMRVSQLFANLSAQYAGKVYRFDPWRGLRVLEASESRFCPINLPAGGGYDGGLQNELQDLPGALRFMEKRLREEPVAFVLEGLELVGGDLSKNVDLIRALRVWALDHEILERQSVICLATAEPLATIDAITLELGALVRPENASEAERLELVGHFQARSSDARPSDEANRTLATALRGLNLHQVNSVLAKAYFTTSRLDCEGVKHFKAEYLRRSEVLEIEEPSLSFSDIGGYEPVKQMVRKTLIRALQRPQRAELAALPLPRGLLIYGPPGTGKTLFAKALARETSLPFINLRTENLFGQYLGQSGQRVRDAIHLAEQAAPAIVFVDEIDRFGTRSSGSTDGSMQETARVFAQMLEWLGDPARKSIIVGTTNRPEALDAAFLRPGRFSYCVPFLYPGRKARQQILEMQLGLQGSRKQPAMDAAAIRIVLPQIATETNLYAGADLEELVIRAKQNFFDSDAGVMTAEHVMAAHQDYRVSVEDRQALASRYQKLGPAFANSQNLLEKLGTDE